MSTQQPSMGRVVIFRDQRRGSDEPAIITRVWGPACVNLKVLPDGEPLYDAMSVTLIDPNDKSAHGWFWPPRV